MDVRFVTGAVGAAVVAVVVSGCGGSSNPAPAGGGHLVPIVERDFAIKLPGRIAAGHVTFTVKNDGPDQHELIVVRLSDRPLPMRRDGITIDEEKLGSAEVGSLDPGPPGSERRLSLDLKPGRYRVFCNMYGHYMSGMSADLVAS